jgi:hypothetical protein
MSSFNQQKTNYAVGSNCRQYIILDTVYRNAGTCYNQRYSNLQIKDANACYINGINGFLSIKNINKNNKILSIQLSVLGPTINVIMPENMYTQTQFINELTDQLNIQIPLLPVTWKIVLQPDGHSFQLYLSDTSTFKIYKESTMLVNGRYFMCMPDVDNTFKSYYTISAMDMYYTRYIILKSDLQQIDFGKDTLGGSNPNFTGSIMKVDINDPTKRQRIIYSPTNSLVNIIPMLTTKTRDSVSIDVIDEFGQNISNIINLNADPITGQPYNGDFLYTSLLFEAPMQTM